MALNGQQFQEIESALLDGYRDAFTLRRMVRFGLDESLDQIAGGRNLTEQVFSLIEWADRSGRVLDLVRSAYEANPGNEALTALHDGWITPPPAAQTRRSSHVDLTVDPAQVFLSYSRTDVDLMARVAGDLRTNKISVWTDEGLEPGAPNWQAAIEAALRATECMVVLLSPEAKDSAWVNIEVTVALRLGRRIFPVLVRGDEDNAIPISLATVQFIDARQAYDRAVADRLAGAVGRYLGIVAELATGEAPAGTPDQAKPATPRPSPAIVTPAPVSEPVVDAGPIAFDWVTIPAGEFLMGSDKARDSLADEDEMPQHPLYLPEYRIARVPVTNGQYELFVKETGHRAPDHWKRDRIPDGRQAHPVVNVSWHDAIVFCEWAGVKLPSEAEWEKAARGEQGNIWPWGDQPPTDKLCNFDQNVGDTTPVGAYPDGASPYGLLDMAGNVWEWTGSLWGKDWQRPDYAYPYDSKDGREDLSASDSVLRTLRGGSWYYPGAPVRCAFRDGYFPLYGGDNWGFRVVVRSPGS